VLQAEGDVSAEPDFHKWYSHVKNYLELMEKQTIRQQQLLDQSTALASISPANSSSGEEALEEKAEDLASTPANSLETTCSVARSDTGVEVRTSEGRRLGDFSSSLVLKKQLLRRHTI
jgi:hypothetical protein